MHSRINALRRKGAGRPVSRSVRPGSKSVDPDTEYASIARDMAEMVGEIDPYGIADAVEAAGYEATGDYSEDVALLAQVYLDTLNDPKYGVPYAITILREEYLPYIGEYEEINRMAVSILHRLEALDRGSRSVRSGAKPKKSAKSKGGRK